MQNQQVAADTTPNPADPAADGPRCDYCGTGRDARPDADRLRALARHIAGQSGDDLRQILKSSSERRPYPASAALNCTGV